ncbi:MAG: class I mannose-6-phosphate isomerase [Anaerolineae bacterium]|nr:class I mannose-6-phosphate isomerase [Anaerolineae bacterium]
MAEYEIYPLTFEPVFRDYIWGGRNLETRFGRTLPPGIVAESWDISGHPSSSTKVDRGPLAGLTLPEVQARLNEALVGTRSRWATDRNKFPLLIKLLDANRALSVQVHPPDNYALEHENGELGKTEMWYVLYAKPDAQLVYGLSKKTTAAAFRTALQEGTLAELLHYLPIQQGDAIYIPTGTIHALLEGAVVAEIQQNSDTTYRVYDWGRLGADGKPRPLHIDKALDVINFDMIRPKAYEPVVVQDSGGVCRAEISRCPYFCVEKVDLDVWTTYQGCCDGSTFEIWGCVSGQVQVRWTGEPVSLPAVRFALLPAALCEFSIYAERPATLLRAFAPE